MDEQLQPATLRKLRIRITWFAALLFFANYIDRVNVSFAALQMNHTLHLSPLAYGFGAGVFYLGYIIFEVPSNLLLYKIGPRIWIARIMITWGLISAAMSFAHTTHQFYFLRFLLGVAEAGSTPGVIYYLGRWIPANERAKAVSRYMSAGPIAIIVGAPISGLILSGLNGLGGLEGWRWLFILEGLPVVLLGIVTLFALPDRPEDAQWLDASEREKLIRILAAEAAANRQSGRSSFGQIIRNPTVLRLVGLYFCFMVGTNAIIYWLPQIISGFGHLTRTQVSLLTAVPYIFTFIVMDIYGRHSDRTGERRWHIAICAFSAAAALVLSAYVPAIAALACISVACAAIWSCLGPFWALPTSLLTGSAAAGGLAMINSIGQMGGFAGPYVVGWIKNSTHSYTAGLTLLAAAEIVGGLLVISLPIMAIETIRKNEREHGPVLRERG